MRYLLIVLLLSACSVLMPTPKSVEYTPPDMLGNFGEEEFQEPEKEVELKPEEVQPKPKKLQHVIVNGLLPPCKPDPIDKEKAILQQIECLAETADKTEAIK